MPQISLQKRTANVGSCTFLQEMLINIKARHFHSFINNREQLFHRAFITGYFRPVNIAKFLTVLTGKDRCFTQFSTGVAGWLLLIFFICLDNQLSSIYSIISTVV